MQQDLVKRLPVAYSAQIRAQYGYFIVKLKKHHQSWRPLSWANREKEEGEKKRQRTEATLKLTHWLARESHSRFGRPFFLGDNHHLKAVEGLAYTIRSDCSLCAHCRAVYCRTYTVRYGVGLVGPCDGVFGRHSVQPTVFLPVLPLPTLCLWLIITIQCLQSKCICHLCCLFAGKVYFRVSHTARLETQSLLLFAEEIMFGASF